MPLSREPDIGWLIVRAKNFKGHPIHVIRAVNTKRATKLQCVTLCWWIEAQRWASVASVAYRKHATKEGIAEQGDDGTVIIFQRQ